MKVSLNWLTDYVDVSAIPAGELAETFTRIGLCCDAVEETESDVIFDLDVTNNRPDCLGHVGVAREAATALGLTLKLPDLSGLPTGEKKASELTDVQVLDPDLCPRYTARVITGVKVGPSPAWLVERVEAAGLRSINNVVDVTNYVLMEYSQPLHAFDYELLRENRIVVRRARQGEEIVSIDGTRCELSREMLIIADAEKPVAVAGIMGGLESEINQKTTTVLLESAQFDPMTTRKTARLLRLMTESSYRFERGVDPVGVDTASLRACQLILETGGGELAEGVVDVWAQAYRPAKVTLRTDRCRSLLGLHVDDATQVEILERLGLSPKLRSGKITCAIPSHRSDLSREVDLIEEVARLHGYEKIPVRRKVTHSVVRPAELERVRRGLRLALAAAGFSEAVTYTFIDEAEAALFGFQAPLRVDEKVRRTTGALRPTVLPSLLRACKTNQDVGNDDVNLYELSAVFPSKAGASSEELPDEHIELGVVTQRGLSLLRGMIEAALGRLAPAAKLAVEAAAAPGLADGAAARIHIDGREAGVIGAVDHAVLDYYGLSRPHAAAAVSFDALLACAGTMRTYRSLPRFPAIRRDLSLVVDEGVTWQQLAEVFQSTGERALEQVQYTGTYRGQQVSSGKKSVTVSLSYRQPEETLRHEQVDEMVAEVLRVLQQRLGAQLRH